MPSFVLSNVALIDPQGRVALSLARVLVTVSPRSLWRRGFEQIYISLNPHWTSGATVTGDCRLPD